MNKYFQSLILASLAAGFAACTDDLPLTERLQGEGRNMLFTASIAQQDFYGTESKTRAASLSEGFYDLAIEGNNELKLAVSTVGGIFGKANDFADKGIDEACQGGVTRGAMLTELRQESMLVLEHDQRVNGWDKNPEPFKATTCDGIVWEGGHHGVGGYGSDKNNIVGRRIFAFYPVRDNYKVDGSTQTMSYTVPEEATEQCDLLFASYERLWGTTGQEQVDSLHLTFNHLLTAVRFKVGRQELPMSVIKRIEISGIHDQGSFDCNTNSWTVNSSTGSATATLDFNVTGMSNTIINSGENTFMLMPQTLPSGAKVTVYYTDNSQEEQKFTAMLSSSTHTTVWQPGKSITYTLMTQAENSEYVLEVEQPESFTAEGGTHNINILSYKRQGDVLTPVKWGIQSYSGDGGKTWMDGGNANPVKGLALSVGEGYSDKPMLVGVTLAPAEKMNDVSHSDILRYTPSKGQDGDAFDLSTHDFLNKSCKRTTANCYVVDAPGTYRFPTAYGNGIVDGETNSQAYANGNFVDAFGNHISAPMIQQSNGMKISRAALVWQDSEDLIRPEDIQLIDGGNAIQFTIRPEHIAQGNATIAALDAYGNVLWSWHIWVTDDKSLLAETIPVTDAKGGNHEFMALNIGWCSTATVTGSVGRELAVRITQPDEALNNRASFRVLQHSKNAHDNQINTMGNSPYYNWGRKDPFPGAMTNEILPSDGYDASDCKLKPFYQAGDEAGTLGLHAEMHVEYGPNLGMAAASGAILGANGFLTGFAVGRVFSALKDAFLATAPSIKFETGVEAGQSVAALQAEAEISGGFTTTTTLANGKTIDIAVFGNGTVKAFGTVPATYMSGMQDVTGLLLPGTVPDVLMMWDLSYPTFYSALSMGSFARVYLPTIALGIVEMTATQTLASVFDGASLFSSDGDWLYEVTGHGASTSYGISHPHVLFRNPISWANSPLKNLWNARQGSEDSMDESVIKTVYDPSPAGYCVPPAHAFSSMDDETTSVGMYGGMCYFPITSK